MNFFEHQDRARRKSLLLVVYFILAVVAIVAAVDLVAYLFVVVKSRQPVSPGVWMTSRFSWWIAATTMLVIIGGSLRKIWTLRDGGTAVAELVGATEVPPDTPITDEHQLINVVEEMSIAAGIPAPRVFVMRNEKSINAFVAGYKPTEVVLVVSQGALDDLNRDELQGVIAHEYSHIFNADMKLNLRLIAGLAGILAIGRIGQVMLRSSFNTRRTSSSNNRSDSGGVIYFMLAGLVLVILGYIGLFFGRLIKAAISRQRELLADASSVQFTRNPSGIANALIKIRNGVGSLLHTSHAEDMSHMCFGETVNFHLQGLLATHPPIDERLRAIGPEWVARARVRARESEPATAAAGAAPSSSPAGSSSFVGAATVAAAAAAPSGSGARASARVGQVRPEHMGYARSIIQSIPEQLRDQLHQGGGARYAMYALAISANREPEEKLIAMLPLSSVEQGVVKQFTASFRKMGTRMRLPLIDLALPALKRLPEEERTALLEQLETLVRADNRLTLFEFTLTRILRRNLHPHSERNERIRFRSLSAVERDCQLLLSLMVHASGAKGEAARDLFHRSGSALLPAGRELLPPERCKLNALEKSLERLQALTPLLKAPVVDACAFAVLDDRKVQVAEAELLRAICALLDCPMPPLFEAA